MCWWIAVAALLTDNGVGVAENWPRWRGPDGNAVSAESPLPVRWGPDENVKWKTPISGEGSSSPIVWGDRLFLTASEKDANRRQVHCLDCKDGKVLWSRAIEHQNPERSSALTGNAAPTPVTDGKHVVAFFGNAGIVCLDFDGKQLWHKPLEEFDCELGIASSPVIYKDRVVLVCDHDGKKPTSFDSYLLCLELATGKEVWKADRPGLFRSWSTPILVQRAGSTRELIVNAQEELRGYDPDTGKPLWRVTGMTDWVTPSPVFGNGLIFATSGKAGPVLAVKPGGQGDVSKSQVAWRKETGGPYVCSPVLYGDHLYVHRDDGVLTCFEAKTGKEIYQERLAGKFIASSVAGDGKIYLTNEDGVTYVLKAGPTFQVLSRNPLKEYTLASPAISGGNLFLRTEKHLWCLGP